MITVKDYKADFPLLMQDPTIYIDNAATTQRPGCVLDAEREFYEKHNANPLRGIYDLSVAATEAYESARDAVRDFIGARSSQEMIFTRNTTESINLVAYSYGLSAVHAGGRGGCFHNGASQQSASLADGLPSDGCGA